jgi:hypothetical protein
MHATTVRLSAKTSMPPHTAHSGRTDMHCKPRDRHRITRRRHLNPPISLVPRPVTRDGRCSTAAAHRLCLAAATTSINGHRNPHVTAGTHGSFHSSQCLVSEAPTVLAAPLGSPQDRAMPPPPFLGLWRPMATKIKLHAWRPSDSPPSLPLFDLMF